jgi:hypothetical protein
MKTRALLLALPIVAVAVASCRDNRASVTIQDICYPTKDCAFADKCDKRLIGAAIVDATGADQGEVVTFLQVANQLADNSSADLGRTNTNDAHLDQVAIEYEGAGLPKDVYNLSNVRVPTAGSTVVQIEAIRGQAATQAALAAFAASAARPQLVANVRLRGYFDDGSRFETGEFPIAVDVCSGCVAAATCGAGQQACPNVAGMEPTVCGSTN